MFPRSRWSSVTNSGRAHRLQWEERPRLKRAKCIDKHNETPRTEDSSHPHCAVSASGEWPELSNSCARRRQSCCRTRCQPQNSRPRSAGLLARRPGDAEHLAHQRVVRRGPGFRVGPVRVLGPPVRRIRLGAEAAPVRPCPRRPRIARFVVHVLAAPADAVRVALARPNISAVCCCCCCGGGGGGGGGGGKVVVDGDLGDGVWGAASVGPAADAELAAGLLEGGGRDAGGGGGLLQRPVGQHGDELARDDHGRDGAQGAVGEGLGAGEDGGAVALEVRADEEARRIRGPRYLRQAPCSGTGMRISVWQRLCLPSAARHRAEGDEEMAYAAVVRLRDRHARHLFRVGQAVLGVGQERRHSCYAAAESFVEKSGPGGIGVGCVGEVAERKVRTAVKEMQRETVGPSTREAVEEKVVGRVNTIRRIS